MAGVVVIEAANDRPLVHDPRAHWQQVTNLNARHGSRCRPELPSIFNRRIRLRVPRLVLAGTPAHPKNDNRTFATGGLSMDGGTSFETQYITQRQPRKTQHSRFQETASLHRE